jgi:excisionase family DNA binding protein
VTVRQIAPTHPAKPPAAKRPRGRPRQDGLLPGSAQARQADEQKRVDRQKRAEERQKRREEEETITVYPVRIQASRQAKRAKRQNRLVPNPQPRPDMMALRDEMLNQDTAKQGLVNVDEVCRYLGGISKPMVYRLIGTGKLFPVKIGRRSMFTKKELDRYIQACQS